VSRVGNRLRTVMRVLRHFASRQRWFLVPLLIVILAAGLLLVVAGGLSYVAPFVYSLF
jgi:uncharacterized protein DUF5989